MVRLPGARCVVLAATLDGIREGPEYVCRRMSRVRGFETEPRTTGLKEAGLATSLRQRGVSASEQLEGHMRAWSAHRQTAERLWVWRQTTAMKRASQ